MKHVCILLFLLLLSFGGFAQDSNVRFIRFTNYTVAKDKLVQQALKSEKVAYVCIPSGLVAVEISPSDPDGEKRITNLLKGIADPGSFEFVPLTMTDAEASCASHRNE